MHALVIDDSKAMRIIIGGILKQIGFQVTEAGNGSEALEQLRQLGKADLAMVDWNMPVMNGFDFVCAVRAEPAWEAMRMIMVTTETEMSQIVKAIEAGANEYVMKPFTKDMIREKLELLELLP